MLKWMTTSKNCDQVQQAFKYDNACLGQWPVSVSAMDSLVRRGLSNRALPEDTMLYQHPLFSSSVQFWRAPHFLPMYISWCFRVIEVMSFTPVEQVFLAQSGRLPSYEKEKITVLEVTNVAALGRLVALRFLEWVRDNPNGVIALPTGELWRETNNFITARRTT